MYYVFNMPDGHLLICISYQNNSKKVKVIENKGGCLKIQNLGTQPANKLAT